MKTKSSVVEGMCVLVSGLLCALAGCEDPTFTGAGFSESQANQSYGVREYDRSTDYVAGSVGKQVGSVVAKELSGGDPVAGMVGGFVGEAIGKGYTNSSADIKPDEFHVTYVPGSNATARLKVNVYSPQYSHQDHLFGLWRDDQVIGLVKADSEGSGHDIEVALPPGSHRLLLTEYVPYFMDKWCATQSIKLNMALTAGETTTVHVQYSTGSYIRIANGS